MEELETMRKKTIGRKERRIRGKKRGSLAAVSLMSLVLAACGGGASQTAQPAQTETAAQESAVQEGEAGADEAGGQEQATEGNIGEEKGVDGQEAAADTDIATSMEDLAFAPGGKIESDTFTGNAYIKPMVMNDEIYNFPQTNNIIFEPGARSGWHTHGGMVIIGTGGTGYYQEEGKPAQIIREGDVIECEAGVKHWHGATPDSWFSQIVIYDSHYTAPEGAEAEEPVTDEYYEDLETEDYAGRVVTDDNLFMFQKAEEPLISDTFSGPAYVSSIIGDDNVADAPGLHYVVFEPGVINNWHTHEGGQILIATDGIGYHQVEGGEVEVLYPGDVALCPPGVKHWHGGSADTEVAHIAVNTNPELTGLEWFDRISEEEYGQLPTEKTEE
jgi:Uncharacterized conserved protein, contains double-stranded beta-helix domain